MPGRSSLSEVEHANSQLAATRLTSMHFLDSQSMQELLEPIQVCRRVHEPHCVNTVLQYSSLAAIHLDSRQCYHILLVQYHLRHAMHGGLSRRCTFD